VHAVFYRWPRAALLDSLIERAIERAFRPATRLCCGSSRDVPGARRAPARTQAGPDRALHGKALRL